LVVLLFLALLVTALLTLEKPDFTTKLKHNLLAFQYQHPEQLKQLNANVSRFEAEIILEELLKALDATKMHPDDTLF
jgi:hypothetical protein